MGSIFHLPHRTGAHPHYPGGLSARLSKLEGLSDFVVLGAVVLLGAAIVYGLLTTTGSAPWY